MLDIKLIREHPDIVRENLKKRNDAEKIKLLDDLIAHDEKWRKLLTKVNELRHKRKLVTTEVAELKKKREDATEKIREAQIFLRK